MLLPLVSILLFYGQPSHGEVLGKKPSHGEVLSQIERFEKQDYRACNHFQQMGCIADVMEKTCESDEGPVDTLLAKHQGESVWMCCCPAPYAACAKEHRVAACDAALHEFIAPLSGAVKKSALIEQRSTEVITEQHAKLHTGKMVRRSITVNHHGDQEGSQELVKEAENDKALKETATRKEVGQALLKVWNRLRQTGNSSCTSVAPSLLAPMDHAKEHADSLNHQLVCGSHAEPPVTRSLANRELFCSMLTWQLEELGDGNKDEFHQNGCHFDESRRASDEKGDERKNHRLSNTDLPDDWPVVAGHAARHTTDDAHKASKHIRREEQAWSVSAKGVDPELKLPGAHRGH